MKTADVALGGILAALAVIVMLLGGVIPVATYVCPMLASMLLIPLLERMRRPACFGWFCVTAALSLILCPDRETAMVFAFLGWYPIAREHLSRLPAVPAIVCKLLVFNAAVAAMYGLLIFVFRLEALVEESKDLGLAMFAVLLIMGNVTFVLYDRLLLIFTVYYRRRAGPRRR